MELHTDLTDGMRQRLMRLYADAFPPEERRPLEHFPPADEAFRFYAVGDAGLLTAWEFAGFTYIEHFAVFPHMRGRGIGSQALALLSGPVILEVEPPELGHEARRRIAFYERNGFRLLPVGYVQPPYAPQLPAVPLRLMARGDIGDVKAAISLIHRRVYGVTSPE